MSIQVGRHPSIRGHKSKDEMRQFWDDVIVCEVIQMGTQTALQPSVYEQALVSIVRTLPVERIVQVLDYARYIKSQTIEDFDFLDDDESAEEILADEARWDDQFAATQDGLKKMADKVRADIRAGCTMPMVFTKDGGIAPE